MSTIVVHTETEEQEKAVKAALESLHVSFEDEIAARKVQFKKDWDK